MNEVLTAGLTGITAFTVTNLDDIVLLTVFFSQVNTTFRRRHIVLGQYLGFCVLLLVSLPGFLGAALVPRRWIGLLGLVPITLGLSKLVNPEEDSPEEPVDPVHLDASPWDSFLSPYTYSVAAITVANGTDNLGIYMPLFATCTLTRLLIIVVVFLVLVGVWCYGTSKLVRQQAIAQLLTQRGHQFLPFILIGLGTFIVLESSALHPLALAISGLCLAGLVKKSVPVADLQAQPIASAEPPDFNSPQS
jgi:cadmium resistance transport/sequestration family protein